MKKRTFIVLIILLVFNYPLVFAQKNAIQNFIWVDAKVKVYNNDDNR